MAVKRRSYTVMFVVVICVVGGCRNPDSQKGNREQTYGYYVQKCLDTLMVYGTDRYGEIYAPILVSILDVTSRDCPQNPEPLDEEWRVTRRERRNPAGANLLTDQPLLKSMYLYSTVSGNNKYADFARQYTDYYLKNLVDDKDLLWWGWHRHYDVYEDIKTGHQGNHHEIHAVHCIDWEHLWQTDPATVSKAIKAIWHWHVIDKKTCEINRHDDGKPGCDFSMSAGAYIEAFAFLYTKTHQQIWLDRANLLRQYYWDRRNTETDLFPDRPNAGTDRFDGGSFVTAIPGLFCHSLLKTYELTGDADFLNDALAYLKAYARFGFDETTGKFWGALRLDGSVIPGPCTLGDYAQYEPRGHLDLWEPYVLGYQYPIYAAQAYAHAYHLSDEPDLLIMAERFAKWIENTPVGVVETEKTWFGFYSNSFGKQGTYAGKYGRTISFFLHLYVLTENEHYLQVARRFADSAIKKLYSNGLFRGHPAKPYYEAVDGVGYLLYALLELDQILKYPDQTLTERAIPAGNQKDTIVFDNW